MEDETKVLMLPWLAHGHISPFMELSRRLLTKRNSHIFFCSTEINLSFVKKNFDDLLLNHSIELVELHLPDSPELPPQFHTTKNLPPHLMSKLMQAFQMAESSFSAILNRLVPDLLFYDGYQSWAPVLAAEKSIPAVHFITSGAATMSFFYHMHIHSGCDEFPFSSIFLRGHEKRKLKAQVESDIKVAEDSGFKFLELSSEIVLIKTCRELEKRYLDYFSFLTGKELVTIGPLVQEPYSHEGDKHNHTQIINFLNAKAESSVVFISFGSEYFLSEEEREEIAKGLELSNVDFIWVIRFPEGQKVAIEAAVPEGFLERVKNRGIVVEGWAPQAKILEHRSTGGFVSHCGWSSVMESLHFGVPIISMPMQLDQPINARLLGETGVGLEVLRDENGKLNREGISIAIKMVVLEKCGEEIRGKAKILSEKLRLKGTGSSGKTVEFMQQIQTGQK